MTPPMGDFSFLISGNHYQGLRAMKLWSWHTSCPDVPCKQEITTSVVTCFNFSLQGFPGPSYPGACCSWFNFRFSYPSASTYVGLGGRLGEGHAKGRCSVSGEPGNV